MYSEFDAYNLTPRPHKSELASAEPAGIFQRMELAANITTLTGPLTVTLGVLISVALSHPEPQVRARAERILTLIFRSR